MDEEKHIQINHADGGGAAAAAAAGDAEQRGGGGSLAALDAAARVSESESLARARNRREGGGRGGFAGFDASGNVVPLDAHSLQPAAAASGGGGGGGCSNSSHTNPQTLSVDMCDSNLSKAKYLMRGYLMEYYPPSHSKNGGEYCMLCSIRSDYMMCGPKGPDSSNMCMNNDCGLRRGGGGVPKLLLSQILSELTHKDTAVAAAKTATVVPGIDFLISVPISVSQKRMRRDTLTPEQECITDYILTKKDEFECAGSSDLMRYYSGCDINTDFSHNQEQIKKKRRLSLCTQIDSGGFWFPPFGPRTMTSSHQLCPTKKCSICLEGVTENNQFKIEPCGHVFHVKCASSWLRRSNRCPNDNLIISNNPHQPHVHGIRSAHSLRMWSELPGYVPGY